MLATRYLSPAQLFVGVKLVEALYHLHPHHLWRTLTIRDHTLRRLLRHSQWHTTAVYLYEIVEFVGSHVKISPTGKVNPGTTS